MARAGLNSIQVGKKTEASNLSVLMQTLVVMNRPSIDVQDVHQCIARLYLYEFCDDMSRALFCAYASESMNLIEAFQDPREG